MDKRTARRIAHMWVGNIIEGALGNGSDDGAFTEVSDEDATLIEGEIKKIRNAHWRDGEGRPGRARTS